MARHVLLGSTATWVYILVALLHGGLGQKLGLCVRNLVPCVLHLAR